LSFTALIHLSKWAPILACRCHSAPKTWWSF